MINIIVGLVFCCISCITSLGSGLKVVLGVRKGFIFRSFCSFFCTSSFFAFAFGRRRGLTVRLGLIRPGRDFLPFAAQESDTFRSETFEDYQQHHPNNKEQHDHDACHEQPYDVRLDKVFVFLALGLRAVLRQHEDVVRVPAPGNPIVRRIDRRSVLELLTQQCLGGTLLPNGRPFLDVLEERRARLFDRWTCRIRWSRVLLLFLQQTLQRRILRLELPEEEVHVVSVHVHARVADAGTCS
mmetsp:Transcript_26600/g.63395  ORF Transcript_26600/g.63395 Transcript_26600/m.63395 type:complete len:241 (-) Transcript_26600:929-1651(-)